MKPQTILHITPFFSPNIGGVETHLADLISELDKLGYRTVTLTYSPISTPDVSWKKEERVGHKAVIFRFSWLGFNLFHRFEKLPVLNFIYITPYLLVRSILWLIVHSNIKFKAVHSHGLNGAIIGIVLQKLFKIPRHIVSIYSTYDNVPTNNSFTKLMVHILNSTDKVLTQSRQSVSQLKVMGVGTEKLDLYRHWINLRQFKPLNKKKLRQKMGVDEKFSILFVGRMIPPKGALLLAKAATSLSEINFLFVGNGSDYTTIKKMSETNRNIRLLGNVPYKNLHLYYNLADVFCIPSLYNEGWGRVIMEALACGLPVVASNLGAITEVIDDSVALIVSPKLEAITESIKKLYVDHQLFENLRKNATKYAMTNFSAKSVRLITKYY
ncbi:glycosyltransferase family 4 protein [Patescibacteria group bacterium]|nr:glycosyltransferase family 4 protein [Patescibacteria group bacterium]MBU1256201.1 glycosyltransferase family 4 protein [Patescibacteria group bacterium]MBU1457727.1 glycosyltransferase family 4 protein [Patescibacteria group bacterium]